MATAQAVRTMRRLRDQTMNETAIKWWVRFLESSETYRAYIEAVKSQDTNSQKALLKDYPKISEIYADFGEFSIANGLAGTRSFREWLEPRRCLFVAHSVQVVNDLGNYKPIEGRVLIEVQITDDIQKVKRDLAGVIDAICYSKFHAALHGVKMFLEHPKPRYVLEYGDSPIPENTMRAIKKAYYIGELKRRFETAKNRKIKQTELVYVIKSDPKNPFGWRFVGAERDMVKDAGTANAYVDTDELTTVKRQLKAYKSYVDSVLNGRFPS